MNWCLSEISACKRHGIREAQVQIPPMPVFCAEPLEFQEDLGTRRDEACLPDSMGKLVVELRLGVCDIRVDVTGTH